jgi:hypothetical protein
MAYVVSPRRHLAPTVGQIDMLGGVFIRMGSVIAASGVRVVSGLVQRLGSLSFISDNAGCLVGRPFPRDGQIMSFGSHEVYVGTERVCRKKELVAADLSVFWIPGYPGPPAPRPLQWPSFGPGCNHNQSYWRRPS